MSAPPKRERGFTLVELLVVCAILGILITLVFPGLSRLKDLGAEARCASSLRQLCAAAHGYFEDNDGWTFPFAESLPDGSTRWFFGVETAASRGGAEGDRSVDVTQSPLYPYIELSQNQKGSQKVEVCPAFPYTGGYWKPKMKGASYGYGYNLYLSPPIQGGKYYASVNTRAIDRPGKTILFADCAQVNTFQSPASLSNPLLEEFYMIDSTQKLFHFRHGGCANVLFLDGHIERFRPYRGTTDTRIAGQVVGNIVKRGDSSLFGQTNLPTKVRSNP